ILRIISGRRRNSGTAACAWSAPCSSEKHHAEPGHTGTDTARHRRLSRLAVRGRALFLLLRSRLHGRAADGGHDALLLTTPTCRKHGHAHSTTGCDHGAARLSAGWRET